MRRVIVLQLKRAAWSRLTGPSHSLQTLEGHPYLPVEATFPIDLRGSALPFLHIEFRPEWVLQFSSRGILDVRRLRCRVVIDPFRCNGFILAARAKFHSKRAKP
jgi:hypothetical protein